MDRTDDRPLLGAALCLIPAIWLGLLIGVSFIATPVKFAAPTLELGPALDVGRVTFGLFSRIEWGVAAVLVLAVAFAKAAQVRGLMAGALAIMLAVQALWLLPVLDARVAAVIAGEPLPPSWHHTAYAGLEVAKAALLLALAVAGLRRARGLVS